jgi:16S rRNA (cytosine967-C5)-methyltransferase
VIGDFKVLPLDVAAKDGRARRTVVAAVQEAAQKWAWAEAAVNKHIRAETGLRSTERRFVGEAAWALIRRYEPHRRLAEALAPGLADPQRILLQYFIYLVLEREAPLELVAPKLAEAGLPADSGAWAAAKAALRAGLSDDERFAYDAALPLWLVHKLGAAYGDQAPALAEALNHRAPVDLRVNLARSDRAHAQDRLRFEGVVAAPTPYSPWGLRVAGRVNINAVPSYREGIVDVQDEGSQLLAVLTGAEREETVADVCAGGGGKLAALAALMEGRGTLVALDVDRHRLREAEKRLGRLGLAASEYAVIPHRGFAADPKIAPWLGECHRVLVDAPCSGTGSWRRHPAERWRMQEPEVARLVATQADVLANAARLVRPGGRLVYATCSVLPEENEQQVERFLAATPGFTLVALQDEWPERAAELGSPDGRFLQPLPHTAGTDGFFAALLLRTA